MKRHLNAFFSKRYVQVNIVLIIIILVANYSIRELRENLQNEIGKSLETVVSSTQTAYHVWANLLKRDILNAAQNPSLINLTERLLQYPPDPNLLIHSEIQQELRKNYNSDTHNRPYYGFFIISLEDYISYGSLRDENIGVKNLIADNHPSLLSKIKNGEIVFIPPIISDVQLHSTNRTSEQLTMFLGAPIKNDKGEIIAIYTLRIDPLETFALLAQKGRIGKSGETYLIDETGLLLTQSRFIEQLKKINLVSNDGLGILDIKITDPGVNLIKNNVSDINVDSRPLTKAAAS